MSSKTELIRSESPTLVPPRGKVKPGPRFANRQEMQPWLVWTLRLASAILFFGLWEWASRTKVLDPFFFPAPSQILGTLGNEFTKLRGKPAPADFGEALGRIPQAKIWGDIWETLAETMLGFLIGTGLGLGLGFLFGRVKPVSTVYMPLMVLLNALPRIALGPLFLIWFGIGFNKSVALSVSIVLFIVFFNVYSGLKEVDQSLINNARILGANEAGLIRHVLFPSAVGWIFNSLRISVSFALVGWCWANI